MAKKRRLRAKNRFGVVVPFDVAAGDVTMNNGNDLETEINQLKNSASPDDTKPTIGDDASVDFSIVDDDGNAILSIIGGHIQTNGFNSNILPSIYQPLLRSGENIKTVGGQSLLGTGDIPIGGSAPVAKTSLNVLFVGNSYSMDTAACVPKILRAINPDLNVTIGILHDASLTLQDQLTRLTNNTAYATVFMSKSDGTWESNKLTDKKPATMFAAKDWDVVVLHQRSVLSGDYRTVEPYLDDIISYINTHAPNAKIGWLITQAMSDANATWFNNNSDKIYDSKGTLLTTSDAMYNAIVDVAKHVAAYHGIDFVIPTGTAIQMLRGTTYGEPTESTTHLKPGPPVLTAGYCMAVVILKELGYDNATVWGCSYIPASNDDPQPNPSGATFEATTAETRRLSQKCAMLACQDKFNTQTVL